MRMRRHLVYAALLPLGLGLLAGCGQKGPLVLPTKPAPSTPAVSAPAPATSAARPASASSAHAG